MRGTNNPDSGGAAEKVNAPVTINDVVVAGRMSNPPNPLAPTGEFGPPHPTGGYDIQRGDDPNPVDRIFNQVSELAVGAAVTHIESNFSEEKFQPGKENNVTRLLTNEFFFYTKEPLTIAQFEVLQNKIAELAKELPENFHLILGSFAVVTPDNAVMNIVPQIECGPKPTFNFTVKNNPSAIDPVYTTTQNGYKTRLPNVTAGKHNISNLAVNVNGTKCPLSFNNVFQCKTAGGAEFHSAIDICLDHKVGVAKKNMNQKIIIALAKARSGIDSGSMPRQCAHAVISNTIPIEPNNCVGGITHADPFYSYSAPKNGVAGTSSKVNLSCEFGSTSYTISTAPTACSTLAPQELSMVDAYNQMRNPNSTFSSAATSTGPKPPNERPPPNFNDSLPVGPPPSFVGSYPAGPPPSFAGSFPVGPPPSFAGSFPVGPPPSFAGSFPVGPPPSFAGSLPVGPPPSFKDSLPVGPPPSFKDSLPVGPPPSFKDSLPVGPPPSFKDSLPVGPPPARALTAQQEKGLKQRTDERSNYARYSNLYKKDDVRFRADHKTDLILAQGGLSKKPAENRDIPEPEINNASNSRFRR